MIYVERSDVPASLAGKDSVGGRETAEAIRAHRVGEKVDFKAYKGADVVQALREMFQKKCAYCEFNYAAGGPEDVEHFRPKGAVVVDGKLSKTGYYWLAAAWSNLLPSCIDCNRKRRKSFAGSGSRVSGKANLFPVADEKRRWRSHRNQNREEPLLLNPCEDEPEQHLEFLDQGLVRPAKDGTGAPSRKGEVSIDVYGLLRADLVEQRAAKQLRVRAAIERASEATELAELAPNAVLRHRLEGLAARELVEARRHLRPNEPFLAAARAVFREFGLSIAAQ